MVVEDVFKNWVIYSKDGNPELKPDAPREAHEIFDEWQRSPKEPDDDGLVSFLD